MKVLKEVAFNESRRVVNRLEQNTCRKTKNILQVACHLQSKALKEEVFQQIALGGASCLFTEISGQAEEKQQHEDTATIFRFK